LNRRAEQADGAGSLYGRVGLRIALWDGRNQMQERKPPERGRTEELIAALEREQTKARDLSRRHTEDVRSSHHRDKQVLIERRRNPR
jgi:hypothetical protein